MFKCYDKNCSNEVAEELTLCDPCKEIYYPSAKSLNIVERMKLLAAKAPVKVSVPTLPRIPKSAGHDCCVCEKKKKNVTTVKIDGSDSYICWSHKIAFEQNYGSQWKAVAIRMSLNREAGKGGEQSQSFGKY